MSDAAELPYPVTIVRSRYGGTYEPGVWVAFPLHPEDLPPDWNAGDVLCNRFWQSRDDIGGGATPDEAYADLLRRQEERRSRQS